MSQLGHKRLFLGQCPFIPFSLSEDWNLITRTIVPHTDRQDFPIAAMNESGLGDIIASQFFSPKAPTSGGWIWGAGVQDRDTAAPDHGRCTVLGRVAGQRPRGVGLQVAVDAVVSKIGWAPRPFVPPVRVTFILAR
jgi:hypothetical protein